MEKMEDVPKPMLRKLDHAAEHLLKSDSILEFALDYPDAGVVAGMMNKRLDNREGHTLFIQRNQRPTVEQLKKFAEANYKIVVEESDLPLDATVLVVSHGNAVNLKAMQEYVVKRAAETPPRVMIWEHSHNDQNVVANAFLNEAAQVWNLKPFIRGYENVYVEGDMPSRVLVIANPPLPRMSHYLLGLVAMAVLFLIIYYLSTWIPAYFFKITAPSTKSLPNNPT